MPSEKKESSPSKKRIGVEEVSSHRKQLGVIHIKTPAGTNPEANVEQRELVERAGKSSRAGMNVMMSKFSDLARTLFDNEKKARARKKLMSVSRRKVRQVTGIMPMTSTAEI